jgi:peptidoglycan hydrolase FlgJ
MSPIGPVSPAAARQPDTPAKVLDAAQQFESLLLSQILRAARESGGGWMGSKDASAECATDYAEQQFATVMAKQGGFGLAALIAKGLERASK